MRSYLLLSFFLYTGLMTAQSGGLEWTVGMGAAVTVSPLVH